MHEMDDKLFEDLNRLPHFGSGAVLPDEPDDHIASVKMTVGDIRTIRRIKSRIEKWPHAPGGGSTDKVDV